MKKIILFTLLLSVSAASFSQQTKSSPTLTRQDYLKKSGNQKFVAWTLFGSGAAVLAITTLPALIKQDYLQKSKNQKTAAWLLLTGGVVMTFSGYVLFIYEGLQGDGVKSGKAKLDIALFFSGLAAVGGSIPLFITAAKNKRKAMAMSFKNEMVPARLLSGQKSSLVNQLVPSLSLKISL
jgi:heme/copper-type cytochrome/quinol oxidase subunit 3